MWGPLLEQSTNNSLVKIGTSGYLQENISECSLVLLNILEQIFLNDFISRR